MCNSRENPNPLSPHQGAKGSQEAISLEGDSTLSEVLLGREANTGNPGLSLRVEAAEEAQHMLHLHKFLRGFALQLLAKVIAANLSISRVEEEEHVLLLILHSVELASPCLIGFITKGYTLGQIGD